MERKSDLFLIPEQMEGDGDKVEGKAGIPYFFYHFYHLTFVFVDFLSI